MKHPSWLFALGSCALAAWVCTPSSPLCAEVEQTIDPPWWQQNLNRAARDWRFHHPNLSVESFLEDASRAWNAPPEDQ